MSTWPACYWLMNSTAETTVLHRHSARIVAGAAPFVPREHPPSKGAAAPREVIRRAGVDECEADRCDGQVKIKPFAEFYSLR